MIFPYDTQWYAKGLVQSQVSGIVYVNPSIGKVTSVGHHRPLNEIIIGGGLVQSKVHMSERYRNTIAGLPPGERIFFLFFLNKVCLSKTEFLKKKLAKKLVKMTLNSLEVTKCCKKYFILFLFLCLQNILIFTFFIFRIVFGRTCYGTTVDRHINRQIDRYPLKDGFLWKQE